MIQSDAGTATRVGPHDPQHTAGPSLLGAGFATPHTRWSQPRITETMIDLWGLSGHEADRFRRISRGTGIESRCTAASIEHVAGVSTQERMRLYEELAPPLATRAACDALGDADIDADAITDVIVVSCTGFSAPGLDTQLVRRLGLSRSTRRTIIGFQGCFGAIVGLRTAAAICQADPRARVLVVCVELCSLHLRMDGGLQNQVASALFADGAAAVVVGTHDAGTAGVATLGRLGATRTRLIDEGREWMTWRITDAGFAMTLTKDVPVALRHELGSFVQTYGDPTPRSFAVHPGGPEILLAVDDALHLDGGFGLAAARAVLGRYGNMSSATVLFVLRELRDGGYPLPTLMLAFGPGLTIEGLRVDPA